MTLQGTAFSVGETHGRAMRPENELLAHSQDVGWRSLHAAIFKEAPLHVTEPALDHPFIIYHITHPTEVMRKIEGARREKGLLGPRNICVTPPGTATEWEHHGNPEILQVYLRRSLYEAAVGELYGCDAAAAEIVPRFGIVDPLLEQLSIALAEALRSGAVRDGLYIDTIAQMMAVHLARTHSVQSRRGRSTADACRLPPAHAAAAGVHRDQSRPAPHAGRDGGTRWHQPPVSGPRIQGRYRTIAPSVRARPSHRACEGAAAKHRNAHHRRCAVGGIFVTEPPLALDDSANRDNPRRLSPERMRRVSIEERAGNLAETLHRSLES